MQKESTKDGFDFYYAGRRVLKVQYTSEAIGPAQLDTFCHHVLRSEVGAGLIVGYQPSRFRVRLLPRDDHCWIPVVVWGRSQFSAIASLNRGMLGKSLPYRDYSPQRGSTNHGSGTALWSDIIDFVSLGFQVPQRLGMNPVQVRGILTRGVGACFTRAGARDCKYVKNVGPDGWFHLFDKNASTSALDFGVRAHEEVQQYSKTTPWLAGTTFKVVSGANAIKSCEVNRGGPYDDSIIAYKLITKFRNYNLRATQRIITELKQSTTTWKQFSNFRYYDGSTIKVYGHVKWP